MPNLIPHAAVEAAGLRILGGFHLEPGETGLPAGTATLLLIGWAGPEGWPSFEKSPEFADGAPHPLDRWTQRVVDALAAQLGAVPLYPFSGPPWQPFQAWAKRAGIGFASPIGVLIHPRFGSWMSFRAALALPRRLDDLPEPERFAPCDTCRDRPCLSACPVGAYSDDGFDAGRCRDHLSGGEVPCATGGCLARAACPVGAGERYLPAQIAFHQRAFMAG